MRLLLVEDDLKIAFFVKTGLEESGFAVDHAEDGEDGLHLALTEPYDLDIIDIMLPKIVMRIRILESLCVTFT